MFPSTPLVSICIIVVLSVSHTQGFTSFSRVSRAQNSLLSSAPTSPRYYNLYLHSSNPNTPSAVNEEVAKLRAAAQKAREEAQVLAKEMGRNTASNAPSSPTSITPITTTTTTAAVTPMEPSYPRPSSSDILTLLQSSVISQQDDALILDPLSLSQSLDQLSSTSSPHSSLWKSSKSMTQSSFTVSLQTLSTRTNGQITPKTLGVVSDGSISSTSGMTVSLQDFQDSTIAVTLGSTAFAIASLALLPSNIGATVCYLIAFIPIAWIAVGSSAPVILANLIGMTKKQNDKEEDSSSTTTTTRVTEKKRVYFHEAGHFLCGYLCGLPVIRYSILEEESKASLFQSTPAYRRPQVEFAYSMDANNNNKLLSSSEIATLAVVALSGSVAEILSCGDAQGGAGDLMELDLIFRRRSAEFIGAQKQEELTRWGALIAYQILTKHRVVYEKLVVAMEEGKNVLECIALLEGSK